MIALPPGVRVYLACGITDMRKGMVGLAMLVQQGLAEDPFICVGDNYVAALHRGLDFCAAGRLGRHII
jgi:hypothetical protein